MAQLSQIDQDKDITINSVIHENFIFTTIHEFDP